MTRPPARVERGATSPPSPVRPTAFRSMYSAFVSYSHAADGRLAPALQSALHHFAKPWYRLRAVRVFRDKTSLSATPGLWPVIQEALDASEYFVLLASPDAAASEWVGKEVEHWLSHRGSQRILVVLTAGELVWDDDRGCFDPAGSTALPGALASAFEQEPLWIDLRWAHRREHLSLRDARFRDAVAELAATLQDRPKDEMVGEDVRQHRRTRRIAWSAATTLALLAIGLAAAARVAVVQRDRAVERGAVALSRQLAAQAVSLAGGDAGDLALLLGLEALRVSPTVDARNGLLSALTRDPRRLFHLYGHMGEVVSLAFSADGSELLSVGCEGVGVLGLCDSFGVRRWDARSGEALGVTILPDANRWTVLAAASGDGGVVARDRQGHQWDPRTGEPLGGAAVPGVRSPRGDLAAQLSSAGLVLRRGDTGQRLGLTPEMAGTRVVAVAFDATGSVMATGDADGAIRLWSTDDLLRGVGPPRRVLEARDGAVAALDFGPDGRRLVSVGRDGAVLLWELGSAASPRRLVQREGLRSATFSADGRWLVMAASLGEVSGELELWDARDLAPVATLAGRAPVAVSPEGSRLAAAGADGAVILRDLDRTRPLGRTLEDAGDPQSLAFLGDGTLVAGGRDGTLRVWDVDDPSLADEPVSTGQGQVLALAAHPDGRRVASGGTDGPILLWNLRDRPPDTVQSFHGHDGPVAALDFSSDGTRLASGSFDGTVRLWDVASGEAAGPVLDVGDDVYAVAFDGRGARLAGATENGSVLLWSWAGGSAARQPPSGEVVGTHVLQSDGMTGLAFAPDGGSLVSSSLEQTQWWSLDGAEASARPPISGAFVALHPSGTVAALVTDRNEIQLIDVTSWRPFDASLGAQNGLVFATAFSPDGRLLATAAEDDLVLWDVALDDWIRRACDIARRNLTREEWTRYLGDRPYEATCPDAPEPPVAPLDAGRALGLAVRDAKLGDGAEARRLFGQAARLVAAGDDGDLMNRICWYGALWGASGEVLPACERAVALEPDNADYRDSRGLVRALTGDAAGAMEDFRAYVAVAGGDPALASRAARRQGWIEALEAGRGPFDALELQRLRGEGVFR